MKNKGTVTNYRYFVIAEILAVASFVLNAMNVLLATKGTGPGSSTWSVDFGVVYWLKTVFAFVGLVYAFKSHINWGRKWEIISYFSTMATLWYSVPIVNTFLEFEAGRIYRFILGAPPLLEFNDRIAILIIWSLPVLIIILNLFLTLMFYLTSKRMLTIK